MEVIDIIWRARHKAEGEVRGVLTKLAVSLENRFCDPVTEEMLVARGFMVMDEKLMNGSVSWVKGRWFVNEVQVRGPKNVGELDIFLKGLMPC